MIRTLSAAVITLFAAAASFAVVAQTSPLVQYETRIALPNAAESLFVDEVVFRWSIGAAVQQNFAQAIADGDSSFVVSATDLEFFTMKLDDTTPLLGGVYIDEIIVAGSPQDGRSFDEVIWEFDLLGMELLAFQNTSEAAITATSGLQYHVADGVSYPAGGIYEAITYPAGTRNADKSWELASLAADAAGGYLATIGDADEDLLLHDLAREAIQAAGAASDTWVGGLQTGGFDNKVSDVWSWLNGDGDIPLSGLSPYQNWLPGQPDDQGGEDFMVINAGGLFGWNDQDNLNRVGAYLIEFNAPMYVTRYVDGNLELQEFEEAVLQRTALTTDVSVRNIDSPPGGNGTVFDITIFEQEALNVVAEGSTDGDFCVAPDPRETEILNGGGNTGDGATQNFNKRDLALSELSGGTCTGLLDFPDEDYQTWEQLLGDIDLIIPSRFRGYRGRVDLTPGDGDFSDAVEDVWLIIGVVRSEAEYDGPVSTVSFPETLVDYSMTPLPETPGCDRAADWRTVGLGGTVAQFDEVPNVEGNTMITETVQCNRAWELTRRTTHVFPLRIDGPGDSIGKELEHIRIHFDGIANTLLEAAYCANDQLIAEMQANLEVAESAITGRRYQDAVNALERIGVAAYLDDDYNNGSAVGFNACPLNTNYRGNLTSRGFAAAFAAHDRFLHADSFVLYNPTDDPVIAEIFGLLKPDLRELP